MHGSCFISLVEVTHSFLLQVGVFKAQEDDIASSEWRYHQ